MLRIPKFFFPILTAAGILLIISSILPASEEGPTVIIVGDEPGGQPETEEQGNEESGEQTPAINNEIDSGNTETESDYAGEKNNLNSGENQEYEVTEETDRSDENNGDFIEIYDPDREVFDDGGEQYENMPENN